MLYRPQRRHAVVSIASTIQVLCLVQHLYTANILILVARILVQVQVTAAANVHPTRSLLALFMMVTLMNMSAMLLHLLDFAGGMNGGKGIILDFVGQSNPASLTRILCFDILLYLLQLTTLVISYITNHDSKLPQSSSLPYEDLLLPDSDVIDDLDVEEQSLGTTTLYGKKSDDDENSLWLNDLDTHEDPAQAPSSSTAHRPKRKQSAIRQRRRLREPPEILKLSFPHMLSLIFHLHAPPAPPPLFAGGTPTSPRPNPIEALMRPPPSPTEAVTRNTLPSAAIATSHGGSSTAAGTNEADAQSSEEDTDDDDDDPGHSGVSHSGGSRRSRGQGLLPSGIPGDYWTSSTRGRGRGNGG